MPAGLALRDALLVLRRKGGPDDPPEKARGWDAIDRATWSLYRSSPSAHFGLTPGADLGGGLDGVSAFQAGDHWHLVSYGLSELYDKVGDDHEWSGWGYELTIRVRPTGDEPPAWAVNLLEQVARQTQLRSVVFGTGLRIEVGGPIDGATSPFAAVAFTLDPQLGAIDTPHGRVEFLHLVGVTDTEVADMRATSTASVLAGLVVDDPLLATDPSRLA